MDNNKTAIDLPQGWKKEVAKIIGVHYASMTRILKNKNGYNYKRVAKAVKEKYGIII